eukprot:5042582-Pleurochrysis_carterae.AAC.1
MCLDPSPKRIYVSPHARFIEAFFPGLTPQVPSVPPTLPLSPYPSTTAPASMDDINDTDNGGANENDAPLPPCDDNVEEPPASEDNND